MSHLRLSQLLPLAHLTCVLYVAAAIHTFSASRKAEERRPPAGMLTVTLAMAVDEFSQSASRKEEIDLIDLPRIWIGKVSYV